VETFPGARPLLARLPTVSVPCCIVTDLRMPGMDGLALQDELCASSPALVFLTGYADVPTALRVMKRGAVDVLQKPVAADVLIAAVEAALRRACEQAASRDLVHHDRERYTTLTPRERQVFALVTAGLLNKQVGYELGTSEKTVKVQRARVMEKMGAHSLPDLVRMADRLGIGPATDLVPAWAAARASVGRAPDTAGPAAS
jgi:FixJ family two-component response regulator